MTSNLAQQFLLDPEVTFLNHGSFGACPKPVFEDYQRWQLVLERQPVAFLDSRRGLKTNLHVAREVLAQEMGSAIDNIAQVSNATTGLNLVIQSLPLKAGDEILTTNHEYNALEKTWTYVARKTGAKIVLMDVPLPLTSAQQFHDAVAAGFTVWGRGDWTGLNQPSVDALGTAFGALVATTWGSYHAVWFKLGLAQWIERVTTFVADHKTVVEQVLDALADATPEDKAKVAAALTPQQIT